MERVKNCTFKQDGVRKDNTPYKLYEVETESGKKGSAFDELAVGSDVEVKESEYQGKKQYQFFKPKATKGFPQKDYTFEKKRVALECAVSFSQLKPDTKSTDVIKVAQYFFTEFLNKQ